MKKSELQALYREVKEKKRARPSTSLFDLPKSKGCKSCGRVTWRPSQ